MEEEQKEATSPMKEIGETLKSAREEANLSLNYIAEVTRIHIDVLKEIENGSMNLSPAPVFIRGFIRTYATLLGIDYQPLKEKLNLLEEFGASSMNDNVLEKANANSEQSSSSQGRLLGLGVVILLVIGIIIMMQKEEHDSSELMTSVPPSVVPTKTTDSEPQSANPNELEQPSTLAESTSSLPTQPIAPVEEIDSDPPLILNLIARKDTWLDLRIDEEEPNEWYISAGEEIEWKAKESFKLTIGNINQVELLLNGNVLQGIHSTDLVSDWLIDRKLLQ